MNWKWFNFLRYPRQVLQPPRRGFSYSGGVVVTEDTAMQASAFYRGVIYISSQIAKLPWELKDKNNKILDNRVAVMLRLCPNSEMTSMAFRLTMIQNAIIHGNAYAEIERDMMGRPIAIWPIPSRSVELYRRPDTRELVYRVIAGSQFLPGEDVYLPFKDVFHLKNFHTKDGLVGQGVIAYGSEILGISLGADRMAANLFGNGGVPSGVLEVPGTLSDEAFARVKKDWTENHGGKKSGGIAVLEEGMKFSAVTMAPDILQFLESRKFSVIEIARFLGLPPTKLYDTERNSYHTQEQSNLEVATDTLDAWARSLEAEVDMKILNNQFGGTRSELDLYAVFRGDMTTRANYFSKMMQTAAITPNEIRMREGMAPYVDGDRYFVAVNNYSPADRIDEIIDAQIHKGTTGGNSNSGNQTDPNAADPNATDAQLTKAALEFLKGR